MSDFSFPWEYNFPPFFTIQPNLETRRTQLEVWRSLLIDYCLHYSIHKLNFRDHLNKPPFYNASINRRLDLNSARIVIQDLVDKKFAEWTDTAKETCLIYTRPPAQWAKMIYDHVKDKSLHNTVQTFYELLQAIPELDETMLIKALKILQKEGKCAVMEMDGYKGVKFV